MGHTKYSDLKDLEKELDQIRKFEKIKEKSPGVFYFKSTPFLHFHDKDGVRWADARLPDGWKHIDINFASTAATRKKFLSDVISVYKKVSS